jgi:hypothetical protein
MFLSWRASHAKELFKYLTVLRAIQGINTSRDIVTYTILTLRALRSGTDLDKNFIDRFPREIVYWARVSQLLGRSMKGEW